MGFEASTAIVGNSVPVGVGAALASAIDGSDEIAVVFLGDALFETGVFFESLNIAATFDVPVLLFVKTINTQSILLWKCDSQKIGETFWQLKHLELKVPTWMA